jgi:hypothetical protein
MIAGLYWRDGRVEVIILNPDLQTPVLVSSGNTQTRLHLQALTVMPVTDLVQPLQRP